MHQITEEYVSTIEQTICGRVYGPNDVVPGASALPTLPALLRVNRIRVRPVVTVLADAGVDLGTAQAPTKRMTKAEKAKAKAAAEKL